ncbi:MAG: hypothetical protein HY420_02830 [Candidatus Kerfeldbacteria bacterium]|nr:hypothetical protein [Candidatus Kerfeldbacteria bacterium]
MRLAEIQKMRSVLFAVIAAGVLGLVCASVFVFWSGLAERLVATPDLAQTFVEFAAEQYWRETGITTIVLDRNNDRFDQLEASGALRPVAENIFKVNQVAAAPFVLQAKVAELSLLADQRILLLLYRPTSAKDPGKPKLDLGQTPIKRRFGPLPPGLVVPTLGMKTTIDQAKLAQLDWKHSGVADLSWFYPAFAYFFWQKKGNAAVWKRVDLVTSERQLRERVQAPVKLRKRAVMFVFLPLSALLTVAGCLFMLSLRVVVSKITAAACPQDLASFALEHTSSIPLRAFLRARNLAALSEVTVEKAKTARATKLKADNVARCQAALDRALERLAELFPAGSEAATKLAAVRASGTLEERSDALKVWARRVPRKIRTVDHQSRVAQLSSRCLQLVLEANSEQAQGLYDSASALADPRDQIRAFSRAIRTLEDMLYGDTTSAIAGPTVAPPPTRPPTPLSFPLALERLINEQLPVERIADLCPDNIQPHVVRAIILVLMKPGSKDNRVGGHYLPRTNIIRNAQRRLEREGFCATNPQQLGRTIGWLVRAGLLLDHAGKTQQPFSLAPGVPADVPENIRQLSLLIMSAAAGFQRSTR